MRTFTTLFAASILLALTPCVRANGLDRALVPANAQWVAHFDVEALAQSKTWTELIKLDEQHELQNGLNEFAKFGKLDPLKDLTGVTVFSAGKLEKSLAAGEPEKNVVIVLSGNARLSTAVDAWIEEKHPALTTLGHAQVYALDEHGKDAQAFVKKSADGAHCTLVIGDDATALGAAIDVLEGRAQSLVTATKPALAALPFDHSILFFAASGDLGGIGDFEPVSKVGKLAQGVRFDLGEAQGKLSATLRLETRTAQDALKIQQVVQGIVAMISLAGGEEPESAEFLGKLSAALSVKANGNQVELAFAYDVATLVSEIQAMNALKAEEKAEKSEKHEKHEKHEPR